MGVCPMQSAIANSSYEHKGEKHHQPAPEDAVTFQVVLIGSDGLVVASERMDNYGTPCSPGEGTAWQRSRTKKYFESEDGSVICFSAGGPSVRDIARSIALKCRTVDCEGKQLSLLQWEDSLKNVADEVVRLGRLALPDEIIIVRRDVRDAAWLVVKHEESLTTVSQVSEWRCTGDNSAARFLPWHLWISTSVRELKCLAVLAIGYAHQENPSAVSEEFDVMTPGASSVFTIQPYRSGCAAR